MSKTTNTLRTPTAGVLTVLALAAGSFGLTACGESSGSASSRTNAAAAGTTGASGAVSTSKSGSPSGSSSGGSSAQRNTTGSPKSRFSAIRECLRKNGVTPPTPPNGSARPHGSGGFLSAGGQLPRGVTQAQLRTALKKCGVGGSPPARGGGIRRGVPIFRQALGKYVLCLRQNGVNVPPPNPSGKGPVFSTKGINTASPRFKAATTKCRGVFTSALRTRG